MPAIPDPSLIRPLDPEPAENTRVDWNAQGNNADAAGMFEAPPESEWPTFRSLPERFITAQAPDEPDHVFRSRCYVAACYWASEDAKAQPVPEVTVEERRKRNAEAVARHREKRKREELAAMTPEEQAWLNEVNAIDVYCQGLDSRVQQIKAERAVATARRAELTLALAQRKRERDRK